MTYDYRMESWLPSGTRKRQESEAKEKDQLKHYRKLAEFYKSKCERLETQGLFFTDDDNPFR